MRKAIGLILLACVVAGVAVAQAPPPPAKYLWIESVQLNTGKAMVFQDLVRQVRQTAADTAPGLYWVAASPLTGSGHKVNILIPQQNMAELETTLASMMRIEQTVMEKNASFITDSAAAESGATFMLAKFRPDLSYHTDRVQMPFSTRWKETVFYLKPGTEEEFAGVIKQVIELEDKVADPRSKWTMYEMVAGGELPAYVIVETMKSLAEMDAEPTAASKETYNPMVVRTLEAAVKASVLRMESNVMFVRPDLSRPHESMIAANPEFWTVKEPAPKVAAKPAKKMKGKTVEAELKKPE